MATSGFALASCSAVGSAMCEFGRKKLVKDGLDATTIVAVVCLLEGVVGMALLTLTTGLPLPGGPFWAPALAAAAASALTTSLLARAYSANDISLCAPFNAALPVLQLLVTTFLLRDEAALPARKIAGVCIVAACAFWLARAGRSTAKSAPLLPPGASTVLFCCAPRLPLSAPCGGSTAREMARCAPASRRPRSVDLYQARPACNASGR